MGQALLAILPKYGLTGRAFKHTLRKNHLESVSKPPQSVMRKGFGRTLDRMVVLADDPRSLQARTAGVERRGDVDSLDEGGNDGHAPTEQFDDIHCRLQTKRYRFQHGQTKCRPAVHYCHGHGLLLSRVRATRRQGLRNSLPLALFCSDWKIDRVDSGSGRRSARNVAAAGDGFLYLPALRRSLV